MVLVTSMTAGSLDDMMLGTVNAALDAMCLMSLYVHDHVFDAAVLATIASPTLPRSWQSLTVKWMENGRPSRVRTLVKSRDFVCIETTGRVAQMPQVSSDDGSEGLICIGYHILHLVHPPATLELEVRVRGSLSVCGLYIERASRPGVVEVFVKERRGPGGRHPARGGGPRSTHVETITSELCATHVMRAEIIQASA